MGTRRRTLIPLAVVCALGVVVTAAAAGLYDYTDAELGAPEQPIQFSHKIHAGSVEGGDLGIQCLYCHGAAEKSQHATVPAVSSCMGCHTYVAEGRTEGSKEEIAKLRDYYERGESIPWIRIQRRIDSLDPDPQPARARAVQALSARAGRSPVPDLSRARRADEQGVHDARHGASALQRLSAGGQARDGLVHGLSLGPTTQSVGRLLRLPLLAGA
jgi:hypothetical protein